MTWCCRKTVVASRVDVRESGGWQKRERRARTAAAGHLLPPRARERTASRFWLGRWRPPLWWPRVSTAPRSRRGLRVLGEASGFSDLRVLGPPGSRTSGFSECRVLGAPGSRGPVGYRIIDLKELSEKSRRGKISWILAPQ